MPADSRDTIALMTARKKPTTNQEEKRVKTSINLKVSLRNAAIKHLIDLTNETQLSKAIELALLEWLDYKSKGTQK